MKYTVEEIQSKVNKLNNMKLDLEAQRKALNKSIRDIKKQIEHWEDFDISQHKAF